MFGKNKEFIKVPAWYYPTGIVLTILIFIGAILISNRRSSDYKPIIGDEIINPITLTGNEDFGGGLRGAVFYKPKRFIYEGVLISIACQDKKDLDKFEINPGTLTFIDHNNLKYKLSDLRYPFQIFKGKDSIIHIQKGSCKLNFKLTEFEGNK
ncbi:hypothetical protein GCM10023149_15150 [Mucilaginibacter gynuensis]|uniref:Uncharacterized protein n=1 Tax=Mucilaginibacter gynuensis TaxID=1302236 RepID=A0ABP8G547_9SPHI